MKAHKLKTNSILLVYYHRLGPSAPTIMEHVESFRDLSSHKIFLINIALGFPKSLYEVEFAGVILHYSLFSSADYPLSQAFLSYLDTCRTSRKIAFFQDEYYACKKRFHFINTHNIDTIYTLLEPSNYENVYKKYTTAQNIKTVLPGYVGNHLLKWINTQPNDHQNRSIDIGYRARRLEFYVGKGGQEKSFIAEEFIRRSVSKDLNLDISTCDRDRKEGSTWYEFLANIKATLGVESGVSVFDTSDTVYSACKKALERNPKLSFTEVHDRILKLYEDRIYYRTISPRHFEAAGLNVCQILFEGDYSGVMKPNLHYIPLKKDFSNFDEVIERFKQESTRDQITKQAFTDLIASNNYSYAAFMKSFDDDITLLTREYHSEAKVKYDEIEKRLNENYRMRIFRAKLFELLMKPVPYLGSVKQRIKTTGFIVAGKLSQRFIIT